MTSTAPPPAAPAGSMLNDSQRIGLLEDGLNRAYGAIEHLTHQVDELATLIKTIKTTPPAPPSNSPDAIPNTTSADNSADLRLPASLKIPNPEKFDGTDRKKLVPWLSTLARTLTLTNTRLDSRASVLYASLLLTGRAQTWWASEITKSNDSVCAGFNNFQEFSQALSAYIEDPNKTQTAMRAIAKLKQTGSVHQYATEYFNLLHQIPHRADEDAKWGFINGLKPYHYGIVIQANPKDIHEARLVAIKADDAYLKEMHHSSSFTGTRGAVAHSSSTSSSGPAPMELNSVTARPQSRGRSRGRSATPGPSGRARSTSADSFNNISHLTTKPFKKLSPDESKLLTSKGICTFCRQKGHDLHHCPRRRQVNGFSSRSASPASRQGK